MEFKKEVEGTKITYYVSGRLDTNTAPVLNNDLTESLEGMTELVLDLKDLEYISSAGVRVLLSAYKIMSKRSGMILRNLPDMVREVLSVTGLLDFLHNRVSFRQHNTIKEKRRFRPSLFMLPKREYWNYIN